jgi:hypothetical protein
VGSGGTAVFVTNAEAGPVALITAGVLFLLVAIGGVMPTRLKVGDNEAEWTHEIREAAEAVTLSAAAYDQNKLNTSLGRLNDLSPPLASSIATLIHIARSFSLIEQATDGRHDVDFSTVAHDGAVYMILEASNGNKALVQPMANDTIATTRAIEMLREGAIHANDLSANRILLVLNDEPSGRLRAAIDKNLNIVAVVVGERGIRSLGIMLRSIEKLLDLDFD